MNEVWEKPKLIVLVRGKPQEAVLASCKTLESGGPDNFWMGVCTLAARDCSTCDTFGST